jgi:hypothetical protein
MYVGDNVAGSVVSPLSAAAIPMRASVREFGCHADAGGTLRESGLDCSS